jgi:hypothetical protein
MATQSTSGILKSKTRGNMPEELDIVFEDKDPNIYLLNEMNKQIGEFYERYGKLPKFINLTEQLIVSYLQLVLAEQENFYQPTVIKFCGIPIKIKEKHEKQRKH